MSKYTQSFQFLLTTSSIFISGTILAALPAQAFQFNFGNITSNSATNAAAGESQLFLDVTDANGNDNLSSSSVLFKFSNVGLAASSITQIYFDNSNVLKSVGPIADSGIGVDYSVASGNLNLPGGNSLTNKFVSDFGIKANTPVSQQGVNPGEWVSVLFNLTPTKTLKDVISDMTNGSMRVGMHVQAFSNGGSEAFVNSPTVKPPVVVPTPPVVVPTLPVVVPTPPVIVPTPPVIVPTPPVVVPAPPVVVPAPPVVVPAPPVVVPTPPVVVPAPPVVVPAPPVVVPTPPVVVPTPPVVVPTPPVVVPTPPVVVPTPPVVVPTPPVVVPTPPVVVPAPPVVVPAPPVVVPAPPVVVPTPPVVVPAPPVVVPAPPVVVPVPPVVPSILVPSVEIKPPVSKRVPEPGLIWAMGAIVGKFALRRRSKTITGSSEE